MENDRFCTWIKRKVREAGFSEEDIIFILDRNCCIARIDDKTIYFRLTSNYIDITWGEKPTELTNKMYGQHKTRLEVPWR